MSIMVWNFRQDVCISFNQIEEQIVFRISIDCPSFIRFDFYIQKFCFDVFSFVRTILYLYSCRK
jgi:hypothetical protein